MLKNYLTIAIRNLIRHRLFSLINILGLSIGFSFSLLAFVFIRYEFNFDAFHENASSIYRMYVHADDENYSSTRTTRGTDPRKQASLPIPFADALTTDFPEILKFSRMRAYYTEIETPYLSSKDQLTFIDQAFLGMFSFPLLAGDRETALRQRDAIVITLDVAVKYFGDENPMGKTLSIKLHNTIHNFTVTGIIEKPPKNSSIQFSILLPFERVGDSLREKKELTDWKTLNTVTFIQLSQQADPESLDSKLPEWAAAHFPALIEIHLQPLTDVHIDATVNGLHIAAPTSRNTLFIVLGIACCIVLVGCVNFMNLSIGLSASRQREIGMRKVLGASNRQLAQQFWGEAGVLSVLALLVSLAFVEWLLPLLNSTLEKELKLGYQPDTFITLLVMVIGISLLSSSYPSLIMSRMHPIAILKGWQKIGGANLLTRTLIVLQFSLSIFLITCTLLMFQQLNFMQQKSLGFSGNQVIAIPTPDFYKGRAFLETFRNELQSYPEISEISGVSLSFGGGSGYRTHRVGDKVLKIHPYTVDYNYIDLLGITLLSGRNFSRDFPGDEKNSIIVNQKLVEELGWTEPIGETFGSKTVIGVVEDYHYMSLHHEIEPASLRLGPWMGSILVKINSEDMQHTLSLIKNTWNEIAPPSQPFTYSFLNQDIERQYWTEQMWKRIAGYSSGFATFIACMGVFALSSLAITRRTKEIGIRKVLGASRTDILTLIYREFFVLIIVACFIAAPIAYVVMNRWLQNFAYRINMNPWEFLIGSALTLLTALATVSWLAIKAARSNPVDALRNE